MHNRVVLLSGLLAIACKPEKSAETAPPESKTERGPLSDSGCLPTDSGQAGECCEHDFGMDPRVAIEACGFSGYVGERRDLGACVKDFEAGGERVRIRLEDLDGLSWDRAVALQLSMLQDDEKSSATSVTDDLIVQWTRGTDYDWLLVPGWQRPRRVSIPRGSCSDQGISALVESMAAAPERAPERPKALGGGSARPRPEGTDGGRGGSLLDRYADRGFGTDRGVWKLPDNAMTLVVELLAMAAVDEPAFLREIVATDARWGLPDRRELDGHPVFADDGGQSFFDHFRLAAARFSKDAKFSCPPIQPEHIDSVRTGTHPMWCFYASEDNLDLLVFRSRVVQDTAKLDYIGFFLDRPVDMISAEGAGTPPPVVPAAAGTAASERTDWRPLEAVLARQVFTPDPDMKRLAATIAGMEGRPGVNKTSFCVGPDGRTTKVRTKKKFPDDPMIDQICRDTVKNWRFRPFTLDGTPVETCTVVTFAIRFE